MQVNHPLATPAWGWGYVVEGSPGGDTAPIVVGSLRQVLPFRDSHHPFQELVAEGENVSELWFFNGVPILAIADPLYPAMSLEEWFDLAPKNGPISLLVSLDCPAHTREANRPIAMRAKA